MKALEKTLAIGLLAAACGTGHAAGIDFGVADSFSGFIFGNVSGGISDVEGRMAIGGNLLQGFDVGYRNAYGSTSPSLVVGGNVSLTSPYGAYGSIYNGPTYATNTNATIGPATAQWVPGQVKAGDIVYGGTLTAQSWQYGQATKNASAIDFVAAKTQLGQLSSTLASATANGTWTSSTASGIVLTGDGSSDLEVFDLGNTVLSSISLVNVKAGAAVVINSTLANPTFTSSYGGVFGNSTDAMATHRNTIVYNLSKASTVDIDSFVNGTVLAVGAAVEGSGHLEGNLIAQSVHAGSGGNLEIGYEPHTPYVGNVTPVPEPSTYALMAGGIAAMFMLRRRRNS